jgi:hypothetical protein
MDLSFNNELIMQYFNGDDSYIPSSELIYLHEHPLIRDCFLVQIERMVHETAQLFERKNMRGSVVQKFIDSTIKIGAELPNLNKDNAPIVLNELRSVYWLCKGLLDQG